ncbi:UrcA family protein [Blastomonas sp.]|uniref:UrcA family protein n=1 Tax=Blastomonas sp. TaxID=1909299 RepID=UPI003594751A
MFNLSNLAQIAQRSLAAATATAILFSATVQASPVQTTQAADGRVVRSVEVRFVDLDLTTQTGAATLESRLKMAAKQVCGTARLSTVRDHIDHKTCVNQTMASGKRAMVTLVARAEAGERFKAGERIAVGG